MNIAHDTLIKMAKWWKRISKTKRAQGLFPRKGETERAFVRRIQATNPNPRTPRGQKRLATKKKLDRSQRRAKLLKKMEEHNIKMPEGMKRDLL
jgi:hypothetical protein